MQSSPYHCDASCPNYGPDRIAELEAQADKAVQLAHAIHGSDQTMTWPEGAFAAIGKRIAELEAILGTACMVLQQKAPGALRQFPDLEDWWLKNKGPAVRSVEEEQNG